MRNGIGQSTTSQDLIVVFHCYSHDGGLGGDHMSGGQIERESEKGWELFCYVMLFLFF